MQEARIELLQRWSGGIRADTLQFLLGLCPIVSVPTNEFFFREHQQGDLMFVLELGKVAVLSCGWTGLPSPNPQQWRLLRRDGSHGLLSTQRLRPRSRRLHCNPCFSRGPLPSVRGDARGGHRTCFPG